MCLAKGALQKCQAFGHMAYVRFGLLFNVSVASNHVLFAACYHENHEDQREKLGEFVNVSSLRCPDERHWCRWEQFELIGCVINRLPPLRELHLDTVPSGIQDGQLRRLETLRVCAVEDWGWLLSEATASLKYLHFMVGPSQSP